MSKETIEADCLFCGETFNSTYTIPGVPDEDYCSKLCERADDDIGASFEKFEKPLRRDEW